MLKILLALLLCCSVLVAEDRKVGFPDCPAFMLVTGDKPDHTTKPTGKFKVLADEVVKQIKSTDTMTNAQVWTITDQGKQGLVVVISSGYDLRIDDVTCQTCPNSLFQFSREASDQPWVDKILETWLRIDHNWNNDLAKSTLTTCKVIQVREDMKSVEFPHKEIKAYTAAANSLTPPYKLNRNHAR